MSKPPTTISATATTTSSSEARLAVRPINKEVEQQRAAEQPHTHTPLLSAICHDLRAPLASVTMGANFVLQTTPENEASGRSRRVLQAMLRSCKQMERLIRDFADLSVIEANAIELRPGVHDAREILAMAIESERVSASTRNVELTLVGRAQADPDAPDDPVLLRCDRDRILRAIDHLIDNAIRFAPEGSTVTLEAAEEAGEVILSITDHGPGLSEETLDHLYDRPWHARRASRVGAGLGLTIARGFVTAHNGRLEVTSAPGSTTVSLIIPRDTPSIPPRPPTSRPRLAR